MRAHIQGLRFGFHVTECQFKGHAGSLVADRENSTFDIARGGRDCLSDRRRWILIQRDALRRDKRFKPGNEKHLTTFQNYALLQRF